MKIKPLPVIILILLLSGQLAQSAETTASKDNAKKAAEMMVTERKIIQDKEKSLIRYFYSEGKRLLRDGDYDGATEQFSRILEIDPKNTDAQKGLSDVQKAMKRNQEVNTPSVMAKKLYRAGRIKYNKKDYEGALEDFQNALVLDSSDEDILEWLKKTRRRIKLDAADTEEKDLEKDIKVATKEKTVVEKEAMLTVEDAYKPPEKPERKPVEIEEIVSPEEEAEVRARQGLMKKLKEKIVPAISLTEADAREVIKQLMEITGVTIVIDEGALAKVAGTGSLKLTFSTVNPMPLLELLNIALKATDLGYRIEPDYIWISTPDKLEKENLVTKTYRLKYGVRRVRKVELQKFETKSSSSSSD